MTKKTLTALLLIVIMSATAYVAFKSLEGQDDPFGVEFDSDM